MSEIKEKVILINSSLWWRNSDMGIIDRPLHWGGTWHQSWAAKISHNVAELNNMTAALGQSTEIIFLTPKLSIELPQLGFKTAYSGTFWYIVLRFWETLQKGKYFHLCNFCPIFYCCFRVIALFSRPIQHRNRPAVPTQIAKQAGPTCLRLAHIPSNLLINLPVRGSFKWHNRTFFHFYHFLCSSSHECSTLNVRSSLFGPF